MRLTKAFRLAKGIRLVIVTKGRFLGRWHWPKVHTVYLVGSSTWMLDFGRFWIGEVTYDPGLTLACLHSANI